MTYTVNKANAYALIGPAPTPFIVNKGIVYAVIEHVPLARVSSASLAVLTKGTAGARVSSAPVSVLTTVESNASRVSQVALTVLTSVEPPAGARRPVVNVNT